MDIYDIYKAQREWLERAGTIPSHLLLTHQEYDALRASPDVFRHAEATKDGMTVGGMTIVIEDSPQHILLRERGIHFLRPNYK